MLKPHVILASALLGTQQEYVFGPFLPSLHPHAVGWLLLHNSGEIDFIFSRDKISNSRIWVSCVHRRPGGSGASKFGSGASVLPAEPGAIRLLRDGVPQHSAASGSGNVRQSRA